MKVHGIFALGLIWWGKALAESQVFGFLGEFKQPKSQYLTIYMKENEMAVGHSTKSLFGVVTDSSKVRLHDKKWVAVGDDGVLRSAKQENATSGFSIAKGYLAYRGSNVFYAVQKGEVHILSTKPANQNTPKAFIRAQSILEPAVVPDFITNWQTTSLPSSIKQSQISSVQLIRTKSTQPLTHKSSQGTASPTPAFVPTGSAGFSQIYSRRVSSIFSDGRGGPTQIQLPFPAISVRISATLLPTPSPHTDGAPKTMPLVRLPEVVTHNTTQLGISTSQKTHMVVSGNSTMIRPTRPTERVEMHVSVVRPLPVLLTQESMKPAHGAHNNLSSTTQNGSGRLVNYSNLFALIAALILL